MAKHFLFALLMLGFGIAAAQVSVAETRILKDCHHPLLAERKDWPLPTCDRRLLFFVQRAMNSNTVIYWANLDANGELDRKDPVHVFWRRFNTSGKSKRLGFLEENMLFGVTQVDGPADAKGAHVVINGHKEQVARIVIDDDGNPMTIATLNGREMRLSSAYVGTIGDETLPDVEFIDVYGVDMETGEPVTERVYTK